MNTGQTWQTESASLDETINIAEQIGRRLRGGEVIELISDLGGGKTTFVKGLARGIDSLETVRSPSFTLRNEYQGKQLKLYHFDFYRLHETGTIPQELDEILEDPHAIVVIEWPEIVKIVLPSPPVLVRIVASDTTSRHFEFNFPDELSYLIP